MSKDKV